MSDNLLRSVAIVGGGVAGWMAAAALSRVLRGGTAIHVVAGPCPPEDDVHATEMATLPAIGRFHENLGIDEAEMLRVTDGTFRLGTAFYDWSAAGRSYFHPMGEIGANLNGIAFRHHWLKLREAGAVIPFEDFSVSGTAARTGKFTRPATDKRSVLSTLEYGYHLDSVRYAGLLRRQALQRGVTETTTATMAAQLHNETGFVEALIVDGGARVEAELFIDCTGLLIEGALKCGFEDWTRWLGCDRVVSIATSAMDSLPPCTRATACASGWQWQIPLKHRTGNGYVYSSAHVGDEEAMVGLLGNLEGEAIGEARTMRFTSGRRKQLRAKNVVALGPAAAVLEPLESASLHLIQASISRLLALFPDRTFSQIEADEYNRVVGGEIERLRDFLILHYHATKRSDTPFWNHCRTMEVPDTLGHKLEQFRSRARIVLYDEETFGEPSWASVLIGQDIVPRRVDPFMETLNLDELRKQAQRIHSVIRQGADSMPSHRTFLEKYCAARTG